MTTRQPARHGRCHVFCIEDAFFRAEASAIAAGYTEDAQLLVPIAPMFQGKADVEEVWRQIVGTGGNTLHIEMLEVEEAGVWAYEVGRFTVTCPPAIRHALE